MFSLNEESLLSSQPFQSAQPHQDERVPSTENEDETSPHPSDRLDSPAKSDYGIQNLASPTASADQVDEYLSHLSEELSDHSESHPTPRFNKFTGPQSTWRSWTASERELAESLDKLDAKDLAVHLYNAHALKKRARKVGAQRKSQLIDDGDDSSTEQDWMPSNSWTAWPLPPDLVPREIDVPHWASRDFYQPGHSDDKDKAQRLELQDLLVAQVIKKAKQRNLGSGEKDSDRRSSTTEPEAHPMDQSDGSSISNSSESLDELEPVIMLDDDVANSLLQPMIHHILTKLDGLLEGLRRAQSTYIAIDGSDECESVSPRSKTKGSIPRSGFWENKLERSTQSLRPGPDTTSNSNNESIAKTSRKRRRSRSSIGKGRDQCRPWRRGELRDWSDVLGVASMIGWDSKIVQKAAFRCSTLFDEGIKFRRLEENGDDSIEISVLPNTLDSDLWNTDDEMLQGDRRSDSAPSQVIDSQSSESGDANRKIRCPESTCDRSSREFSSYYSLRRHLRQVHQDNAALEDAYRDIRCPVSTCYRFKRGFPGYYALKRHLRQDHQNEAALKDANREIRCPVSTCSRSSRGFSNYSALKKHMRQVHQSEAALESLEVKESEGGMVGGVNVDGFLQPIPRAESWRVKEKTQRSKSRADQ